MIKLLQFIKDYIKDYMEHRRLMKNLNDCIMTTEEKLQVIKEAIQKAVSCKTYEFGAVSGKKHKIVIIGIREVLMWLEKRTNGTNTNFAIVSDGTMVELFDISPAACAKWNLKQDTLENQSPATIDFLYSLLS